MSEVKREVKVEDFKKTISLLQNKDFGFYFFTLDTKGNPTAGIANIYEHVKVLNELGYRAHILHEKNDYKLHADTEGPGISEWLGEEYASLPHLSIESKELNVGPQDFIVIPEIFSNIMDELKNLPCKKLVFSQSYEYALELLPMGRRWTDYGFNDVITTSDKQAQFIKGLFPSTNTHVVPVSISDYFKDSDKPKVPVVAIHTRVPGDAAKLVKMFYLQNPMFRWVSFKELKGLNKREFAKELSNSCLAVWLDDVSGFGTLPLEAMECNTPVIGKIPNMIPEWMEEETEEGVVIKNNGIWTNTHLNIPELIGTYLNLWLEGNVPVELTDAMESTKGMYTPEKQVSTIKEVYGNIISNRVEEFNKIMAVVAKTEEVKK
tara:strand:+ start:1000 stop:2130 length:1131 start_codon:yes stop_codon:yes gene_type:complete